MFEKKPKYYVELTREQLEDFCKNDNTCIRHEVMSSDTSQDYMIGYVKGVQVALLDLLQLTGHEYSDYRDLVQLIEDNVYETYKNAKQEN